MGQLWAAIKSLGIIATILRDILDWIREMRRKQALDKADETHANNAAAIDAAFKRPPPGDVQSAPGGGSSATPAGPSSVYTGPGSGT